MNFTPDQLDSCDLANGFDDEQPLKDFEKLLPCYNSLRDRIENEEELWLNNCGQTLNYLTDPTENYVTTDEVFQTILNYNSIILIDGITTDLSGYYDYNYDHQVITKNNLIKTCKAYKRKSKWFVMPGNSDVKIKGVLSIEGSTPWGGAVDAKTKSYKKKGLRYFKKRAPIYVEFNGRSKVRSQVCTEYAFLTLNSKEKTRKKVKIKERFWGTFIYIERYSTDTVYDLISFHGINGIYWNIKM